MANLLRKPFRIHGKVHDISPAAAAGWRHVGFMSASVSIGCGRGRARPGPPATARSSW